MEELEGTSRLQSCDFEEILSASSPLAGMFTNIGPPKDLRTAMQRLLELCLDGSLEGGMFDALNIAVEMAIEFAQSKAFDHNFPKNLSTDEIAVIRLYTMSIQPESTSLYTLLNKALRNDCETRRAVWPFVPVLWLLMHALNKAPPCDKNTVFRGIRLDLSDKYRHPMLTPITWPSFTSCTASLHVLHDAKYLGVEGARTKFTIFLTTGRARSIAFISAFKNEEEILLPPNSRFKLLSSLGPTSDGLLEVQLEEISPLDPILCFNNNHIHNLPTGQSMKALKDLDVEEVGNLLSHLSLHEYIPVVKENGISGQLLCFCNDEAHVHECGIASSFRAKFFLSKLHEFKLYGVPRDYLIFKPCK